MGQGDRHEHEVVLPLLHLELVLLIVGRSQTVGDPPRDQEVGDGDDQAWNQMLDHG